MTPSKFVVADDHALIRQALCDWLKETFAGAAIQQTEYGTAAEKLVREEQPDLLILDISLPDKNGLEVLKQLRAENLDLPILILSNHAEDQYALRAFRAGADGYLMKNCTRNQFLDAVRLVLNGKKYISSPVAERMAAIIYDNAPRQPHEMISDRELEVLKLLASGKTVSSIAKELSLGVATISTYRARLLEKMRMASNAELTRYAIDNKLI